MNKNALAIYSFLMANDLRFSRICHDEYHSFDEWKQTLKKIRADSCYIRCLPFYEADSNRFLLLLTGNEAIEAPDGFKALTEADLKELCALLRCQPYTLSPLGLMFDTAHRCTVQVDSKLCRESLWWLSPCSNQSSVLMTPEAVLQQFLPKIGTEILFI